MRLKATFVFLVFSVLFCFHTVAQVTSASMVGFVKDDSDKSLVGAIVRATHLPSGTVYGTDVKEDGSFYLQNMRVGGPYKVTISFGEEVLRTYDNITLELGETYQLIASKINTTQQLAGVSITAKRDNTLNSQRTGASTVITADEITTFPNITRNAMDFTSLSPQSNGNSFEGRDNRYNNIQINGANFNNSFGITSGPLSGGNMPIPLDAVQEIQVAISDFDVRQSDFTGANVNLVTRSGTNDFTGSAYTFYRDQSFSGTHVGGDDLPPATKSINNVYGVRLGGPIIKNKLFFFVNGEYERNVHPAMSPAYTANTTGATGPNISRANADSLQEVSNFAQQKYGYNTGAYPGGPGYNNTFTNTYDRFIARLDYNINEKNKLDVSFTHFNDQYPTLVNSTSAATGSVSNARNGQNSLAFANTDYSTIDKVNSYSLEWVSTISSNVSNQVLTTYTQTRDTRSSPSSNFPFIDILDPQSGSPTDNYTSLGYELFTYKNDAQQNTLTLYDNLTVHMGINNFTAGVSYQYLTFADGYFPYGTSYYRFASIQDFMTNQPPTAFGYTYPYQGQDGYSRVNYGLPGAYVQDKVNLLNNHLTLTGGVRVDMPLYLNTIPKNPYIDTLNLLNPNSSYNNGYGTAYHTTHYNASQWPQERVIVSPRFGFNWSPFENRKLQIRGGTGVFLGQIPFVWFTNAPANSGVVSNNVQISDPSVLQYLKFNPNVQSAIAQLPPAMQNQYFPQQSGSGVPGLIDAVAPNFRMPEVWRSDLSADYKLPWLGMVGTAELMYTKDIYAVYQFNANAPNPTGDLADSNDHRPTYPGQRIYPGISGVYVLANSQPGYSYSETIGAKIPVKKGFYGSVYYTRMYAAEVSANPGSQASSAWEGLDHLNTPNENMLAPSQYFAPNRIVATLCYRYEYAKHLASTLSLSYSGSNTGHFDFTYYDDINGDGIYGQLIYIPQNASELNWKSITNRTTGQVLFTAAQEEAAFNAFMNQDKYLNSHRGQYMQRNGETYPFYNTANLKFIQDIFTSIGKRQNSLQFTVDVIDLPNLLNRNWGIEKMLTIPYGSILIGSTNSKGVTTYQMATMINSQGQTVLPTSTFMNEVSTSSVWEMQLGLRYNF